MGVWLLTIFFEVYFCLVAVDNPFTEMCETMLAVQVKTPGGPENLYIGEVPKPVISPNDILVRIHATAINRADTEQRSGKYPPPPGTTDIIGLEMAGEVEEVGSAVTQWKKGDRVMALLPGGGYAQFVSVPSEMAMQVPPDMDLPTAAGIPEAFLTAFQTLFTIGNLQPHQKVLIHAGASGVGTSAIQLCNIVEGVEVYVTAGSKEKIDDCIKLGAKGGVNYKEGPWLPQLQKLVDGVDIIIDCIGANYFVQDLQFLKLEGKLIIIGLLSGATVPDVSLAPILKKRLSIIGNTLRSRSVNYKIQLTKDFIKFTEGKLGKEIKPIVSQVFNWQQIVKAHESMEKNENIGKIIIVIL